jgi:small subunit ribosomal protein S2
MTVVSMKALLESGVHFGHRTHKWHPAMKPYIFTERNSIHIIDLQKTVKALTQAYNVVRDSVEEGGSVLFVGTKRQAQETIQEEAMRAEMPYVTIRWLGGMLTNWRTIRARVSELERLERMRDQGDFGRITKKEALILSRQIERLEMLLGGIRHMTNLPELLFVVDVRREETAIHEANLLNIPVIALVDTNCDPRNVDYVIPSNDDAIRAIKLLVAKIADAAIEGRALRKDMPEEQLAPSQAVMPGAEEPELSDEELLGAATLAKISSHTPVALEDEEMSEEEEAEEEEAYEEYLEEAELEEEQEEELEEELEVEAEIEALAEAEEEMEEELVVETEIESAVEAEEVIEAAEAAVEVEEEIKEVVEAEAELEAAAEELAEVEEEAEAIDEADIDAGDVAEKDLKKGKGKK